MEIISYFNLCFVLCCLEEVEGKLRVNYRLPVVNCPECRIKKPTPTQKQRQGFDEEILLKNYCSNSVDGTLARDTEGGSLMPVFVIVADVTVWTAWLKIQPWLQVALSCSITHPHMSSAGVFLLLILEFYLISPKLQQPCNLPASLWISFPGRSLT